MFLLAPAVEDPAAEEVDDEGMTVDWIADVSIRYSPPETVVPDGELFHEAEAL